MKPPGGLLPVRWRGRLLALMSDSLASVVLRELGHLVSYHLTLSDCALSLIRVNRQCRVVAQERIAELWPHVQALLHAPFDLSAADLLTATSFELKVWRGMAIGTFCTAIAHGALANLRSLWMGSNQLGASGMHDFSTVVANGALVNLTGLDLSSNLLGDEGVRSLSAAIGRGALPELTELDLGTNNVGDAGMCSLADAIAGNATLANMELLLLGSNKIGDEGMAAFATAIAKGALSNLTGLWLCDNQIGRDGIESFSAALADGALTKLTVLSIDSRSPRLMNLCSSRSICIE